MTPPATAGAAAGRNAVPYPWAAPEEGVYRGDVSADLEASVTMARLDPEAGARA